MEFALNRRERRLMTPTERHVLQVVSRLVQSLREQTCGLFSFLTLDSTVLIINRTPVKHFEDVWSLPQSNAQFARFIGEVFS